MVKYSYDRRADDETVKFEIELSKGDGVIALTKLLKFIQFCGQVGTSRTFLTQESKKTITGWDGDGRDKILSIKVDGKNQEISSEDRKTFEEITR